jgi:TPR repeat protein
VRTRSVRFRRHVAVGACTLAAFWPSPRGARADEAPAAVAARDRFTSQDPACGDGTPERCERLCFGRRDAVACYELGRMYEWGTSGRDVDYWGARALYLLGCRGGDARACNGAGYLYGTGKGAPQSYTTAVRLYADACNRGYPLGCFNVGVMRESGLGVRKSIGAAAMAYRQACAAGNPNACSSLGVFLYKGTDPVWSDVPRGIELMRFGCAGGNAWGCERLKEYGLDP